MCPEYKGSTPFFTDWFWVLKAPTDRFEVKTGRFDIKIARFDIKIARFEVKNGRFDLKTNRFKPLLIYSALSTVRQRWFSNNLPISSTQQNRHIDRLV